MIKGKNIEEIKKVINDGVSVEDIFSESVSEAKKYQSEFNSFVTIIENCECLDGVLKGVPYALKDNFSTLEHSD